MNYSQLFIISCFLAASHVLTLGSAKCNTCNPNGIACFDETTFHVCFKGQPDTSAVFECPAGSVCVADLVEKCLPNTVAECAKERSVCGVCDGRKPFTCISRTTFAQCNSTYLLRQASGICPSGLTCDSSKPEICVVGGAECSS